MSKRSRLILAVVVVLVVVVAAWLGGGALWDLLLRMHVKHR